MRHKIKDERGIALFFVLWVLMLLSVIVYEFCYSMRTEVNITRNFKEETENYYIALAGFNRSLYYLLQKEYNANPQGDGDDSGLNWRINIEMPPVKFENGFFKAEIDNESGKVNINHLDYLLLDMIFDYFKFEDEKKYAIIESISDWLDFDSNIYGNGAENDYYKYLEPPYQCKNNYMDSVGELLFIKGITKEMFHMGLKDVITVYEKIDLTKLRNMSRSANFNQTKRKTFDYSKININAASRQMLLFLPGMTEELAEAVIEFRKKKDFISIFELAEVVGDEIYSKLERYLTLEITKYYEISSKGFVEDGKNNSIVKGLVQLDYKEEKGYRVLDWYDG